MKLINKLKNKNYKNYYYYETMTKPELLSTKIIYWT